MKLSVLIPTHNYVCSRLVESLLKQCLSCPLLDDFEIIVADDGSTDQESLVKNRIINTWSKCRLEEMPHNMGRSRIRRTMALRMRFPLILLMDSDAAIDSPDFLLRYLQNADKAQVLCGGLKVSATDWQESRMLRFRYEQKIARKLTAARRNLHPYEKFSPFNVLIHQEVFQRVNFDETLSQYGYEDVLFGKELQAKGISILHIDNPLIHTGIDSNEAFLEKTETALQNLHALQDRLNEHSDLLKIHAKLQNAGLLPLLRLFHHLLAPLERRNLLSQYPSLLLFNIYKLGYFSHLG